MTAHRLGHAEMFFLDLDGTLLRSDGSASRRTARGLDRLTAGGRKVALATGRPVRQVDEIASALGHRGYSICSNGAVIYSHELNAVVAHTPFSAEAAAEVRAQLRRSDPDVRLAMETPAGLTAEEGFPTGDADVVRADLDESAGECLQVLAHRPQGIDDDFAEAVRSALLGRAEVSWGTPSGPLELTAAGVDKGTTALALAELLGVRPEAVAAFGDMPNDLPLLTKVGHPVAMANAHPSVLARIEGRAPGNDEDGVAAVLEAISFSNAPRPRVREPHRLSFAVAAHPDRIASVAAMCARHPDLDIEVVLDPEPDGPPMAMRTARLAWRSTPSNASHRVVLQDDITLCPGFRDAVHAVVDVAPGDAISLFAEWGSRAAGSMRLAALMGYDFAAVANNYVPTQALVLPADVARGFDTYVARIEPDTREDDLAMARYLEMCGVSSRISVPNLVQHDTGTSLVGNDFMGIRRSTCFASSGVAGKRWDGRVFVPEVVPYFCGRTERALCLVPEGPHRRNWKTLPVGRVLRATGSGLAALWASVDAHPHGDAVQARVDRAHLEETWSMARVYGLSLADRVREAGEAPSDGLHAAMSRPWAAATLSTMAAGALRGFAPDDVVPHVQDVLLDGVRSGFADRALALLAVADGRRGA